MIVLVFRCWWVLLAAAWAMMGATQCTPCADGIDNDGDGFVDRADPGCESRMDPTEDGLGEHPSRAIASWARDVAYIADVATRDAAFRALADFGVAWSELSHAIYAGNKSGEELWADAGDPRHRFWVYDTGHFLCVYEGCADAGTPMDDSDIPETAFLHYGEPTVVATAQIGDLHADGCAPPAAPTKACRVLINGFGRGVYWLYNQESPAFRTYYEARLTRILFHAGGRYDHVANAVFQDWQGETWANNVDGNGLWSIRSGGHVRSDEIAGAPRMGECVAGSTCGGVADPDDPSMSWTYEAWHEAWVANNVAFREHLAGYGAALIINCANWSDAPHCRERIAAASGSHPEMMATAAMMNDQFKSLHAELLDVVSQPHGLFDFFSNTGLELYPAGAAANPHHYLSGRGRVAMTRYGLWLAMREMAGEPGQSWFDLSETIPGGCISGALSGAACLDFTVGLYDGFADVGWPQTPHPVVAATGVAPAGSCVYDGVDYTSGQVYTVWRRDYPSGVRVYARPRDGWACSEYGAAGAVKVPLGGSYRVLREDGSLGPVLTTLEIDAAEAVVLYPTGS